MQPVKCNQFLAFKGVLIKTMSLKALTLAFQIKQPTLGWTARTFAMLITNATSGPGPTTSATSRMKMHREA